MNGLFSTSLEYLNNSVERNNVTEVAVASTGRRRVHLVNAILVSQKVETISAVICISIIILLLVL